MIVGFTSTRRGLTGAQALRLIGVFRELQPVGFHHGCCVGGDEEASRLVRKYHPACRIIAHPPANAVLLSRDYEADEIRTPREYLARNGDIVVICNVLVACPAELHEQVRSGTWSTVRRARRAGKPIRIVLPDGAVRSEGDA